MNRSESTAAILQDHLALCGELHAVLLEENRVMRTSGGLPDEGLLTRKRDFLPRLDASLERLRQINESGATLMRDEESLIHEARNRLMQLLMLDRENERLLLKASLPTPLKAAFAPVAPGQVARAYQRYASMSRGGGPGSALNQQSQ